MLMTVVFARFSSNLRNHCTFLWSFVWLEPFCWNVRPRKATGLPDGEVQVTRSTISPGGRKNLIFSSPTTRNGSPTTDVDMHS